MPQTPLLPLPPLADYFFVFLSTFSLPLRFCTAPLPEAIDYADAATTPTLRPPLAFAIATPCRQIHFQLSILIIIFITPLIIDCH
jgi:hypothetical protein